MILNQNKKGSGKLQSLVQNDSVTPECTPEFICHLLRNTKDNVSIT